jgi:hypothetical protein
MMISEITGILELLHIAAGLGFLSAVVLAIKLYFETDRGWYWLSLVLSAFFFALSQWATIVFPLSIENFEALALVQETSDLLAGLLFAISCFGIYKTMKEIRKRVE